MLFRFGLVKPTNSKSDTLGRYSERKHAVHPHYRLSSLTRVMLATSTSHYCCYWGQVEEISGSSGDEGGRWHFRSPLTQHRLSGEEAWGLPLNSLTFFGGF